ncbi:WhiB family transcriptional regulator [Streptomyces sp. NPDC002044]|uniref:WhiB family transcriptional regulator n=1 Tax=Streptomyces sp. NPDC002044 TaxID=3154662 RepID=UPI00331DEA34
MDQLWECKDLAPASVVRQERSDVAACVGADPRLFFPKPQETTSGAAVPSESEREALTFCEECPVLAWCLASDLKQSSTPSKIIGVRGGMRQSDRRALYVRLFGRRPRNGAVAQ